MRITIMGHDLPGRAACRTDGSVMENVHVGLQVRSEAAQRVPGDAARACWEIDVDVVDRDGARDFRGPAVQGKPGDRFVYLTWGNVGDDDSFEMFRRAKLMLHRIDPSLIDTVVGECAGIEARIDLTGPDGGPRCARVDPPAIVWSACPV